MTASPCIFLAGVSEAGVAWLNRLGACRFEPYRVAVDEALRRGELPRARAVRLAQERAAGADEDGQIRLAVAHVVACGRRVLPPARTQEEARAALTLLSGRAHRVYTGLCVRRGEVSRMRLVVARVRFKRLSPQDMADLLHDGAWKNRAGGYDAGGRAQSVIRDMSGAPPNPAGLPLAIAASLLAALGVRM